jgi:hypothetical protein
MDVVAEKPNDDHVVFTLRSLLLHLAPSRFARGELSFGFHLARSGKRQVKRRSMLHVGVDNGANRLSDMLLQMCPCFDHSRQLRTGQGGRMCAGVCVCLIRDCGSR